MLMKKKLAITLALYVITLPIALAGDEHSLWEVDFDQAVTEAGQSGKDLLVDFSGSDWCGWCQKLDKEVFSQKKFLDQATKEYTLVVLDFPRKKVVKNKKRNEELKNQFQISGYPTVLLMDSTGRPYARTGYQENGPGPYLKHLAELKSAKEPKEIRELIAKVQNAATDDERVNALLDAFKYHEKLMKDGEKFHAFGIGFLPLNEEAREGIALDPDNRKGLKLKAASYLLENGDTSEETRKAIEELDSDNEGGYLEKLLMADIQEAMGQKDHQRAVDLVEFFIANKEFQDQENEVMALYMAGFASQMGLEDKEKARKFYKAALALKPANPRLVDAIERRLKDLDQ